MAGKDPLSRAHSASKASHLKYDRLTGNGGPQVRASLSGLRSGRNDHLPNLHGILHVRRDVLRQERGTTGMAAVSRPVSRVLKRCTAERVHPSSGRWPSKALLARMVSRGCKSKLVQWLLSRNRARVPVGRRWNRLIPSLRCAALASVEGLAQGPNQGTRNRTGSAGR